MVTRSFTKLLKFKARKTFLSTKFQPILFCFIRNIYVQTQHSLFHKQQQEYNQNNNRPFYSGLFQGKNIGNYWVRERERERLRYNFQTPFLRNFYQANTTERKRESIETEKTNSFEIGKKVRVFFRQNFVVASSCCTSPCVRACVWAGFSACCSVQAATATRCPACLGIPKCGVRVARTLRPFSLTLSCYLLSFLFSTFFLHLLHVLSS